MKPYVDRLWLWLQWEADPGSFGIGIVCGILLTSLVALWSQPTEVKPVETPAPEPGLYYIQKVTVTTTGYHCPAGGRSRQCDKGIDDGKTATNKRVRKGICAADWRVFPPGTQFAVPGYGTCRVEDRGSRVRGMHVDLYFTRLEEAKQWGRRDLEVWLLPSSWPVEA